jgi:type IV pilus assembly protein PilA
MLRNFGLWRKKKTLAQTVAEYALIVALVAIASIGILQLFGTQLRSLYDAMTQQIAGHSDAQQTDYSGSGAAEHHKSLSDF